MVVKDFLDGLYFFDCDGVDFVIDLLLLVLFYFDVDNFGFSDLMIKVVL